VDAMSAIKILADLKVYNKSEFRCNGGAFFWVAAKDSWWSDQVVMEVQKTASCSVETLAPSISTSPSVSFAPSDRTRRPTTKQPTTGKPIEEKCGVTCPVAFTGNHPTTNCTGFFYCDSGRMVGKITPCPRGTIYDEIKGVCGWPFDTTCYCGITRKSYAPSSKPTTKMPTSKPTTRPTRTSKPTDSLPASADTTTIILFQYLKQCSGVVENLNIGTCLVSKTIDSVMVRSPSFTQSTSSTTTTTSTYPNRTKDHPLGLLPEGCPIAPTVTELQLRSMLIGFETVDCVGESMTYQQFDSTVIDFMTIFDSELCYQNLCHGLDVMLVEIMFDEVAKCAEIQPEIPECLRNGLFEHLLERGDNMNNLTTGSCNNGQFSDAEFAQSKLLMWTAMTQCSSHYISVSQEELDKATTDLAYILAAHQCWGIDDGCDGTNGDNDDYFDDDTVEENLWYPDWTTSACSNDGKHPIWMTESSLFVSQATCCESSFSWNANCLPPATGPAPGKDDVIIL
jgi:hypothetical protein